jgi:hypothetical protein
MRALQFFVSEEQSLDTFGYLVNGLGVGHLLLL